MYILNIPLRFIHDTFAYSLIYVKAKQKGQQTKPF